MEREIYQEKEAGCRLLVLLSVPVTSPGDPDLPDRAPDQQEKGSSLYDQPGFLSRDSGLVIDAGV